MTESSPGYDKGSQFAKNRKMEPEDWQNNYRGMIASAQEAVAHIQPGQRVFIGTGCGQPQLLVKALLDRAAESIEHLEAEVIILDPSVDIRVSVQLERLTRLPRTVEDAEVDVRAL